MRQGVMRALPGHRHRIDTNKTIWLAGLITDNLLNQRLRSAKK